YDSTRTRTCNYRVYDKNVKTAWHLKKITSPTGDSIQFYYKPCYIDYYAGVSQTITTLINQNFSCDNGPLPERIETCATYLQSRTWHMDSVVSSKHEKIIFKTAARRDSPDSKLDTIIISSSTNAIIKKFTFNYSYFDSQNQNYHYQPVGAILDHLNLRMFLTKINFLGKEFNSIYSYSFHYLNSTKLPSRLSFSQDYYGYYNGKNNPYFVPTQGKFAIWNQVHDIICDRTPSTNELSFSGLLDTISYPTGGKTVFEYEHNKYDTIELVHYPQEQAEVEVIGENCDDTKKDSVLFHVPIEQMGYFQAYMVFTEESCGYAHNRHCGYLKIIDISQNLTVFPKTKVTLEHLLKDSIPYEAGHDYKAIIWAQGDGSEVGFFTSFDTLQPSLQNISKIVGGARITRTLNLDEFLQIKSIKRYFYANLDSLGISSGVYSGDPVFCAYLKNEFMCSEPHFQTSTLSVAQYSNSVNDLYSINGSCISYKNVVVSFGDNFEGGGEEYEFSVTPDQFGTATSWTTNFLINSCKTNNSWNNGLILRKTSFIKNNGNYLIKKKIINKYSEDCRKDKTFDGYSIRKSFTPLFNYDYVPPCTIVDSLWKHLYRCDAAHLHFYVHPRPGVDSCIYPGNHNIIRYSECHYYPVGTILINSLYGFDGVKYSIFCKWNHLDSVFTTTYSSIGTDSITEVTSYQYNNPTHTLPNITKNFSSIGEIIENQNYYPQDYANYFSNLISNHLVGVPIDSRIQKNGALTSGKLYHYNIFGQPNSIDIANNELGSSLSFNILNPYSYGNKECEFIYDETTKLLVSVKPVHNYETDYLWGYQGQYPIAEISGSNLEEIKQILNQGGYSVESLLNTFDGILINNATSYLRNHLPDALVNSFSYEPQVGMTRKTDPSGIKTFFEFDNSGRLKTIKDSENNTVKAYKYHYLSD
ncbi:MAG: hypothetical protein ACM3RX_02900, partial [Methanococcaceae archaeon]